MANPSCWIPGWAIDAFRAKVAKEGRLLVPGSDGTALYGGVRFRTYVVPLDSEWPDGEAGMVILQADDDGDFRDPRDPSAAPILNQAPPVHLSRRANRRR